MGHGLGDNHEAVGQNVLLNVARFDGHIEIVTQARRKGETEAGYGVKNCVYKKLTTAFDHRTQPPAVEEA
jgi:hypothetical protein